MESLRMHTFDIQFRELPEKIKKVSTNKEKIMTYCT